MAKIVTCTHLEEQVEVDEVTDDAKKESDDDTKAEVRDLLIYFYD